MHSSRMHSARCLPYRGSLSERVVSVKGGGLCQGGLCPGVSVWGSVWRVSVQGISVQESLSRAVCLRDPCQRDPLDRYTQKDMGPETEASLEGTWDQRQRPSWRNMGPETETLQKEYGTRQPDRKWHHTKTSSPCEQNDWETGVKTLPSRNFVYGR